jgi:DNA-binding Xre family transcriptional regulator
MSDIELEQFVYETLKNIPVDELQELCKALEMIFCYSTTPEAH